MDINPEEFEAPFEDYEVSGKREERERESDKEMVPIH